MASQTINVTACDNELYLIAFQNNSQGGISYQLGHIQSGNGNPVNLTITVTAGSYKQPVTINGVQQAITQSQDYTVSIPASTYTLLAVGIDWGGGYNYKFSVGETNYGPDYKPGPGAGGVFDTNTGINFPIS